MSGSIKPDFGLYGDEFSEDVGSLRDIYIKETTMADWQRLLDFLSQKYSLEFIRDGRRTPFPPSVKDLFSLRQRESLTLCVKSHITFCCHFFSDAEMEFDLDPHEVKDDKTLADVFEFISGIG